MTRAETERTLPGVGRRMTARGVTLACGCDEDHHFAERCWRRSVPYVPQIATEDGERTCSWCWDLLPASDESTAR